MKNVGLALLWVTGCSSSVHVHRVANGVAGETGIYYALPRTVVVVKGNVKSTTTKPPSPMCQGFAERIGLKPFSVDGGTYSSAPAVDDVSVDVRSEADPEQRFRIVPESSAVSSTHLQVELSELQTLTSGATGSKSEGFALTAKVLNLAGTVAGTVIKAVLSFGAADRSKSSKDDGDADGVLGAQDKCPQVKGLAEFQGCTNGDELKCGLALEGLVDLKAKHVALASYAVTVGPPNKETLSTALAELESLEAQHVAVLLGTRSTTSTPFECVVTPAAAKGDSSAPVTTALAGAKCLGATVPAAEQLSLTVAASAPFLPGPAAAGDPPGLAYRIPARGLLTVQKGSAVVATKLAPIAQLGAIAYLPTKELATQSDFKLDGQTGALLSYSGKSESSAVASAGSFGEAATGAASAFESVQKTRAAAPAEAEKAELEALERKQKKLEDRKSVV